MSQARRVAVVHDEHCQCDHQSSSNQNDDATSVAVARGEEASTDGFRCPLGALSVGSLSSAGLALTKRQRFSPIQIDLVQKFGREFARQW